MFRMLSEDGGICGVKPALEQFIHAGLVVELFQQE
jgi:hypothetical protein